MTDDKKSQITKNISSKQKSSEVRAGQGKGLAQENIRGSGPENRHGMPQLPVGQHAVKDWPVLDLGIQPNIDLNSWRLDVVGLVDNPKQFTWSQFLALPQTQDTSDFHCVTTWSRFDNRWVGVRLRDILADCKIKEKAKYVYFESYDGYSTNIPIEEAIKEDVLLVHTWEDRPLPREHGGPCRVITPQLYAWKGAKWIKKITLLAEDQLGFWELRGYSNTAHPWHDDRYAAPIIPRGEPWPPE